METVSAFNSELSGLYDSKPPISKAKMAMITRAAMKAIKFYKHVVQSVEKFILKCKPEYKIPGLYVIDSIVRQSRHQFGPEKDVFAPRFARNIKQTFANLFRCTPEDKSRIIRVLNLWQKNNVFAPEVIQPLFDLADPNNPIYQSMGPMNSNQLDMSTSSNGLNISAEEQSSAMDESHPKGLDLAAANGHQSVNTLDQSTIRQLQQLQQILMRQTNETKSSGGGGCTGSNQSDSVKFNKKLLDYDYGDEEEEDKTISSHIPNLLDGNNLTQLLKDPNVLRQLQTLQKLKQQEEKQMKLNEMRLQEEAFEKHLQNVLKGNSGMSVMQPGDSEKEVEYVTNDGNKIEVINLDGNDSRSPTPDRDRYKRRRNSRSRSPRGRDRRRRSSRSRSRSSRSRSRGGSRSPRSNRRRNSRERGKDKEREKEKEKEKEYERERRRKGLPDLKKDHLSVCSTTLWVGHLSKLVQQEELSDTFGKYGDIVSIDMIHPRGCAFIVMNRRQDAHKAMGSLKNYKMQGRAITISWAAGKGVKSKEWKDYWDLDLGVSYIPWDRLSVDTDLVALEEGGMFDEDTMPDWMKDKLNQKQDLKDKTIRGLYGIEGLPAVDTSQPPPTAGSMIPGVSMVPPFPLGPVPRLMPPMGVPLPSNMVPGMVPGIPMPPNVVPGMPPPHMLPPGGMFGPIPPPMDKSVPPPNAGNSNGTSMSFMGNMPMPPMQHAPPFPNLAMPPQFNQQQPSSQLPISNNSVQQNDDHMDIEMDDEVPINVTKTTIPMNFNQPPPLFQPPNFSVPELSGLGNDRKGDQDDRNGQDNRSRSEFSSRDRSSRWGNERSHSREREIARDRNDNLDDIRSEFSRRAMPHEQMNQPPPQIWRENGPGPNYQAGNFGDRRGLGGPGGPSGVGGPPGPNMMGIDMAVPPLQRPPLDFFDNRRDNFGVDERRGGQQRDFFQNPGNRFGTPPMGPGMGRGQMPMRGGIQPPFGPRLGPMFMRGPSRPPAFNMSNDRVPFERDDRGGGGNPGGRMRGANNNTMDRRQSNNWRDDDDGSRRGNRFYSRERDRERDIDRDRNREENKSKGKYDPTDIEDWDSLDEHSIDQKSERKITPPPPGYDKNKMSRNDEEDWDDLNISPAPVKSNINQKRILNSDETTPKKQSHIETEEDWDSDLVDHNVSENVQTDTLLESHEKETSATECQPTKTEEYDIFTKDRPSQRNKCDDEPSSKLDIKTTIDPNDFSIPGPSPQSDTATNIEDNQGASLCDEPESNIAGES